MAEKKLFMAGYKKYDDSQGRGSPDEWGEAFKVRMGFDEAVVVLGDDNPRMILGLGARFTFKELKKAYLRKAKEWHPDLNQDNEAIAEINFKKAQAAYVKLKAVAN